MSASDPAPLPRLGEVFFDVRGNSRSMRLSWYADTGVAVLSIWQGGTCTGTFRLAIGDLPRMVETLRRGPGGPQQEPDRARPGAQPPMAGTALVPAIQPPPGLETAGPWAGLTDCQTGQAEYLTGPPGGRRGGLADYLGRQPGCSTGSEDDLGWLPDDGTVLDRYAGGPSERDTGLAGYQGGRPAHGTGSTRYPSGSVDGLRTGPPDGATARPRYLTGPAGGPAAPDQRTEYLENPRSAGWTGPGDYRNSIYVGSRSGAWNAGPDPSSPYARGTGRFPGELAGDAYPGGTDSADYPWEPAAPLYPPGGDAHGGSAADYPAFYRTAVTDGIRHGPSGDSFPHDGPPGTHAAASRRTGADAPSD